MANVSGKRVAILATDGFEQAELLEPQEALVAAGVDVTVIAPSEGPAKTQSSGKIKAWDKTDWGKTIDADARLEDSDAASFDMLVLPGGVLNPDKLRQCKNAVSLVKKFVDAGKPVAAICHGPWTLIEAGAVRGKQMTSWPSLQTDLRNAGANWVDETVVEDNGLITSRKPDDIPAFNEAILRTLSSGGKPSQAVSSQKLRKAS